MLLADEIIRGDNLLVIERYTSTRAHTYHIYINRCRLLGLLNLVNIEGFNRKFKCFEETDVKIKF